MSSRRLHLLCTIVIALSFVPGSSHSEPGSSGEETRDRAERYDRIVAEQRGDAPSARGVRRHETNRVVWVGFHPADGKSTVFIKTAQPVRYEVRHEQVERRVVVDLSDVTLGHANFGRFLDTSHFERGIDRVEVRSLGRRGVRLEMTLDSWEEPTVSDDGEFIFLDLPHSGAATPVADRSDEVTGERDELASLDSEAPVAEETPAPVERDEEVVSPEEETEDDDSVDTSVPFESVEDEDGRVAEGDDDDLPPEGVTAADVPRQHRWAIPVALGGVMVVGGGVGLHLLAERQRDPITSAPRDEVISMTQQEAAEVERRADRLDTAALGLIIAGGTATAIGLSGWLLSSDDDASATTTAISPSDDGFFLSWTLEH